jgi:hypothetical protein
MNNASSPEGFITIANIALGALTGLLISGPAVGMLDIHSPMLILVATLLFVSLGTLSGYKRRHSRGFMYLSVLCVLVLSSLMLRGFIQIQQ